MSTFWLTHEGEANKVRVRFPWGEGLGEVGHGLMDSIQPF